LFKIGSTNLSVSFDALISSLTPLDGSYSWSRTNQ